MLRPQKERLLAIVNELRSQEHGSLSVRRALIVENVSGGQLNISRETILRQINTRDTSVGFTTRAPMFYGHPTFSYRWQSIVFRTEKRCI